jgi:hypothetical protein
MNPSFQFAYVIREKLAALVQSLSIEQLNTVPAGLNNNIAWHLGHLVVSTELLCYHRTGVLSSKTIALADQYRNGTRPEAFIPQEEINALLARLTSSLEQIEADRATGMFNNITPYSTHTFGFELKDFDAVLACCSHHDLLHYGNVLTMRKLV